MTKRFILVQKNSDGQYHMVGAYPSIKKMNKAIANESYDGYSFIAYDLTTNEELTPVKVVTLVFREEDIGMDKAMKDIEEVLDNNAAGEKAIKAAADTLE